MPGHPRELPPGWPSQVRPPDSPDWERSAVGYLLDLCPPDYRGYETLRRHPLVLARFAAGHVAAGRSAASAGLASVRSDLAGLVPPEVIEAAIGVHEREAARLAAAASAVALLERALRGERYVPRL